MHVIALLTFIHRTLSLLSSVECFKTSLSRLMTDIQVLHTTSSYPTENIVRVYLKDQFVDTFQGSNWYFIPVAGRSKARVCGPSFAGIAGSNSARGHGCLL